MVTKIEVLQLNHAKSRVFQIVIFSSYILKVVLREIISTYIVRTAIIQYYRTTTDWSSNQVLLVMIIYSDVSNYGLYANGRIYLVPSRLTHLLVIKLA